MSNVVALESAAPLVVEQARELLARARTVDEAKQIADQGRALAVYVRARKAGLEAEQDAIEIVIRAKARIGEILAQLERDDAAAAGRKGGRGKRAVEPAPTQRTAALESAGISRKEAAACEKLAAAPAHVLELHIAGVRSRSEKLTTAGTIAAVSHGGEYNSDEWYTPAAVIEAARRVLGEIDLDPASCARAQKTVRAKKYYTRDDDGLADGKPWRGRVWCNPPYSQPACSRFVERFVAAADSGAMTAGIILLNASTDTAWWHSLAERFVLCFTRGRLGFENEAGVVVDGNRVGQVFAYHGGSRAFRSVFEPHVGIVLARP